MESKDPEELTQRQQVVLDFIEDYSVRNSCSPTVREIGEACGIRSPNGVTGHLIALEKKGHIHRNPLVSRGVVLANKISHVRIFPGATYRIGSITIAVGPITESEAGRQYMPADILAPHAVKIFD